MPPARTLAELMREVGIQPSAHSLYADSIRRPFPRTDAYVPPPREPQFSQRMQQQSFNELSQRQRIQSDIGRREAYDPGIDPNTGMTQAQEALLYNLEPTGVPSLFRSYNSFQEGRPLEGAGHGALGLLGVFGTTSLAPTRQATQSARLPMRGALNSQETVIPAVHSTRAEFDSFDPSYIGSRNGDTGWRGRGFYFYRDTPEFRARYSGNDYAAGAERGFGYGDVWEPVDPQNWLTGPQQAAEGSRTVLANLHLRRLITDADMDDPSVARAFADAGYSGIERHARTGAPMRVRHPGVVRGREFEAEDADAFARAAERLGYDGGDLGGELVVFPHAADRIRPRFGQPTGALEPPTRLPVNPTRELGYTPQGGLLPVRPSEPFRTSLNGGSDDLLAAARQRPDAGAVPAGNLGPIARQQFTGPRGQAYEVVIAPDSNTGVAAVSFARVRNDGFAARYRPHNDLTPGEARSVYREVARIVREDAALHNRSGYGARGYSERQTGLYQALADGDPLPGYVRDTSDARALILRRDPSSGAEQMPRGTEATAPDGGARGGERIPSRMSVEIQQPRGQPGSQYRIELDGQNDGAVTVVDDGDVWSVRNSYIDPDLRNQGHGVRLYEDVVQRAREAGARTLRSGNSVSADAQNAWMGLQRRGYAIARIDGPDGPRFEVDLTRSPQPAPTASPGPKPTDQKNQTRRKAGFSMLPRRT